ncbi:MAG: class I SAM-dependent methyltransferase [Anaerolineae bacterium]|nr:class I SAM-dependent methyltransferase [Anaerolineae bacterium]
MSGRTLLHLMCHLGLDTLSWARRGAAATGVDFSPAAIDVARRLNDELALEATFICADVYELPTRLTAASDIVFASGGVWPWLRDLDRWGETVAACLRPGGVFYMYDRHPIARVVLAPRPDASGMPVQIGYVAQSEPVRFDEPGSYAAPDHPSVNTAYYWQHGLGEIVTAICQAGLRLEFLHEFCRVEDNVLSYRREPDGTMMAEPRNGVTLPRFFSIRAVKDT